MERWVKKHILSVETSLDAARRSACATVLLLFSFASVTLYAAPVLHITHEFTNTNAQSLIGLPTGSHKTIVDKQGNLRWSHWNLKRKPLDSPFGFSGQLDGALTIESSVESAGTATTFKAESQSLYKGRYPFVLTRMRVGNVSLQDLAFAVEAGKQGLDVVRVECTNSNPEPATVNLQLSGKQRNLPAYAEQNTLVTQNGYLVALVEGHGVSFAPKRNGLTLDARWLIPAGSRQTLWLKLPYDFQVVNRGELPNLAGSALLQQAEQSWQTIWSKGIQIQLPEKELEDFFYSSFAYVLILTERDRSGDLWILDGPAGYRQFWGRGEYFQARALDLLGNLNLARDSIEHAFHIQMDDGEWDGPPISGWPSWDNIGGNAGAAWDYYLFTKDRNWLAQAYPQLRAAANWIRYHRAESDLEIGDVPPGAKPIRREIPWSCKPETSPPLQPGEKPYWSGLLPWSYGDSGLPEGHSFAQNFFCLYAVKCALNAANELNHKDDAMWLSSEYRSYKTAILKDIQRALKLEKKSPAYLPAMPTDPEAAWSQSFVAVYPGELFSPQDPLISGLLTQVERTERQGLPTNMAWLGFSGVWPGESMNVAETYLRRGEIQKTANMLVAALNHSYYTNVWKEEIRVDKTLPVACLNSHKNLENQVGTGDMPEAWGNANMVNLVRDMLLIENNGALHILSGIPASWIEMGQEIGVENATTTLGGKLGFHLRYPGPGKMVLNFTPPASGVDLVARFPIDSGQKIVSARVDGRAVSGFSRDTLTVKHAHAPVRIEVEFQ
jgi:hypothetical protein